MKLISLFIATFCIWLSSWSNPIYPLLPYPQKITFTGKQLILDQIHLETTESSISKEWEDWLQGNKASSTSVQTDKIIKISIIDNLPEIPINSNEGYYMNKETIEKAKVEYPNIEFASHSYGLHENFGKTYEEVNNDIMKMKDVLDSKYYAYPHGSFTDEYISALKDNGYLLAFTFGPGKNHRKADIKDDNYKIPRLNISKDMPMYKFTLRLVLPV